MQSSTVDVCSAYAKRASADVRLQGGQKITLSISSMARIKSY